jgi:peroxiredoxin
MIRREDRKEALMRRRHAPPILVLTILAACTSLTARVQGRVVDDHNQPVEGARISLGGYPLDSKPSEEFLVSDANGEFSGTMTFRSKSGSRVVAMDPEHRWGGIAHFNRSREPVTIAVRPLFAVRGRVSYNKLTKWVREKNEAGPVEYWSRNILVKRRMPPKPDGRPSESEYVAGGKLEDAAFEFFLPAGEYELMVTGMHDSFHHVFRFEESGKGVDLGVLEVKPHPAFALFGSPAPELKLADARGIPKDFEWSSLRGKWVVLFFWDHRMSGNRHWLPSLIKFYTDRQDLRDRVEFIGIHNCDDVLTVRDLDLVRTRDVGDYEFQAIPFPVAIDDESKTFNAYGLFRGITRASPRAFLVNPEGRVEFWHTYVSPVQFLTAKLDPPREP